jgi:hypothetical protein
VAAMDAVLLMKDILLVPWIGVGWLRFVSTEPEVQYLYVLINCLI